MKKIIIALITVSVTCLTAHCLAQKQDKERIDSLLTQLPKTPTDTNKVNLLIDLCNTYLFIDPAEGVKCGEQALALAEKLNWKKGMGYAYLRTGNNNSIQSEYGKAAGLYSKALAIFEETGDKSGKASAFMGMGNVYLSQSDYPRALDHYFKALKMDEETGNKKHLANCYGSLGIVYDYQKDFNKAITYFSKALQLAEETGDKQMIAATTGNCADVYLNGLKDYPRALEYFLKALKMDEEMGNKSGMAGQLNNIGDVYHALSDYPKSLEYLLKALAINKETGSRNWEAINFGNLGNLYLSLVKDTNKVGLNTLCAGNKTAALQKAKSYTDSAIVIFSEIEDLDNLSTQYNNLSEIQQLLGDNAGALESYKLYSANKDSVFNMEKDKKLTETAMQYEFDKKEAATKAEQEKKDIRQRNIRNSISAGLGGAVIFLVVVYRQRNKIKAGKKRSDELLLNILPAETAEELKNTGSTKAKDFDEVTVLFTDFKNFTAMSEKLSAQELVNEINYCYSAFDHIITKHGIEKIKTIGDSYMCAGGLPVANKTNAADTVRAATEIRDFMLAEKQKRESQGKPFFEIRIGCHTGPVVAGIVGIKKYSYDIWGDTVNIASRMESASEPGKVNISGSTWSLVKDQFHCIHRGKIEAKNKGMIDMYFVEHLLN